MKKINVLDIMKSYNQIENDEEHFIKGYCFLMKKHFKINFPITEIIDKKFVYQFKESMKELNKLFLGENRYIYFQRENVWQLIDLYIDFQYNKLEKESLEDNIRLCNIIMANSMEGISKFDDDIK